MIECQSGIEELENNSKLDYIDIPVHVTVHKIKSDAHDKDKRCGALKKGGVKRIGELKNAFEKEAHKSKKNKA